MKCNFVVGQKVVCVSDDKTPPEGHVVISDVIFPELGKIYTVRKVQIGRLGNVPCLVFEEIENQQVEVLINGVIWVGEVIFDASAFRPLVARKTDISCFTAMLNGQKRMVDA